MQQQTCTQGKKAATAERTCPLPPGRSYAKRLGKARPCLSFMVLLLLPALNHAYGPAPDDNDQLCRALLLDETSVSASQPGFTLSEPRDFQSLVDNGHDDSPISLLFKAWLPDSRAMCVPTALILNTRGSSSARIPVPAPDHGWAAGHWHSVEVAIPPEDQHNAVWASLADIGFGYDCAITTASMTDDIKIKLVRVCKALPVPSLCTVVTTDVYTSDCGACDWKAEEAACCESRHFTFCTAATSYGIADIVPKAGLSQGGARVVVTSTTSFVATPTMACRFGETMVVPATLLSARTLACVAPPVGKSGAVNLEVSLDGGRQWTRSGHVFHYCPPGDEDCLEAHANEEDEKSQVKPASESMASLATTSNTASALRQGLMLEVALCMTLAVLGTVTLMYVGRAKLSEMFFFMLANSRFGTVRGVDEDNYDEEEEDENRRVRGWNPTVELTSALMPPFLFRHAKLSREQVQHFSTCDDDEEEEDDVEMEEVVVL